MPSFKIQADIFARLSVFDSPKGSSNTFKTHKNISPYFKKRYLIIYKFYYYLYIYFDTLFCIRLESLSSLLAGLNYLTIINIF